MTVLRLTAVLLLIGALSGCRLYGGAGSKEIIRSEIQTSISQFRSSYESASSDLEKIKAAASNPATQELLHVFEAAVSEHHAQLEISEVKAENSLTRGGYRSVSRVLGSLVAEQTLYREKYRSILNAAAENADIALRTKPLKDHPPVQAVPAYYHRTTRDNVPDVQTILAGLAE